LLSCILALFHAVMPDGAYARNTVYISQCKMRGGGGGLEAQNGTVRGHAWTGTRVEMWVVESRLCQTEPPPPVPSQRELVEKGPQ
jgi:hypothetical protein